MTDNLDETAINVFTDGSSYSHPRRGGIGMLFVVVGDDGHPVLESLAPSGHKGATNNQMELKACIEALTYLSSSRCEIELGKFRKVVIHTDSRYVVDNFNSAKYQWRASKWLTRDGTPVANAQLWKELVSKITKFGMRVEFRWVKGHKSSEGNKAADRLAKLSAKGHLKAPLSVVSVRKKKTSKSVERGSVVLTGQRLTIRIFTVEYLRVQHCWKYKYEVMSKKSPYFSNVDIAFSEISLRDGHTYFVLMNSDSKNPRILRKFREVETKKINQREDPHS